MSSLQPWVGCGSRMTERVSAGVSLRLLVALIILFLGGSLAGQVAGPFTFLGPTGMGGKVRTVVFHPTDPNVGWFGAVGGGVFKTTNGGATWFPVGDGMVNMAVTTLVVDPVNPNILYAGTGDTNYTEFQIGAVPGNGIHKSTDGGLTWTHLAATETTALETDFEFTRKIALNPAQPTHLYVATNSGIFRSTDSGASFTKLNGADRFDCRDVAVRPGFPSADIVLASCLGDTPDNRRVMLRNADAAGTGSFVEVHSETNQGHASFAFAPSSPSTVYALVSQLGSPFDQSQVPMLVLLKSTDSGATWVDVARQNGNETLMKNHLLSEVFLASQSTCSGVPGLSFIRAEGNDKNALAVDPVNANRLYAGGKDFFRSTDGGVSWGIASSSQFVSSGGNMRSGHYAIAFPAGYNGTTSQTMWIGNDTGLYKTDSAVSAATTTNPCVAPNSFAFTPRNSGTGAVMFEDGAVQTGGTTYFGASRRFGVTKGTDAAGATGWTSPSDAVIVNEVMTDPANPMVLYRRKDSQNMQKSVDGGVSWTNASSGISGITGHYPFSTVDPSFSSRLWTGAGQQIYRSMDAAGSWQAANAPLADAWSFTNVAVAPSDPNRVVAVGLMDQSRVRLLTTTSGLTSTGSTSWTLRDPGLFYLRRHPVAIDPSDPQVILLGEETFRVIRSTDFGATWNPVGGPSVVPGPRPTAILIDPAVPGRFFVGTAAGLYATPDGGLSWTLETGMPRAYISNLRLEGRKLFAFTLGRGAWRAVLNSCTPPVAPATFTATATSTSVTTLSWSAVSGVTSYEIWRSSANTPSTLLKTVSGTSTTDTGLTGNTTYVYKVRGVCGGAYSPLDAATTMLFTDDPLTAGTTIRAVHITQLRTAIDAIRAAAGLQPASYTSAVAAGSLIRRTHITEMRTALDFARSVIGLPALSYTDATITAGTTRVKAAHLTDLRNGVK
jgi:hypothetical protein